MEECILIVDGGYGDHKVVAATLQGDILEIFKFPSILGKTKRNPLVDDDRIISYKNEDFYVGEDALMLQSENIIDITEYSQLEYYEPIFIAYIIGRIKKKPTKLVVGLSQSQIGNSGYYQEALRSFVVNNIEYKFDEVFVLSQGLMSKLTIDKYGDNFPKINQSFLDDKSYIAIDIGNNTLDLFQVINGKASPNLLRGIEKEGIIKICILVKQMILERFNKTISLMEAKNILDVESITIRGDKTILTKELEKLKYDYLQNLMKFAEDQYGKVLDDMHYFYLLGGGSYLFRNMRTKFIKVPNDKNEYYNAIGYLLWYLKKKGGN